MVALSIDLLGARSLDNRTSSVAEILNLARQANGLGIFGIEFTARELGVGEAPTQEPAETTEDDAGSLTVHEDEFLFIPARLTIPAGTTVVWTNDEQAKHTATADDDRFDPGDQSFGDSYAYTFSEPGTYPYYCRYHGDAGGVGMAGTIVVE